MARRQYRVSTASNWTDSYGFCFVALTNSSGSGRKFTLRSIECFVNTVFGGGSLPATLYYSTSPPSAGENMSVHACPFDSGTAVPSSVVVRRNAIATGYSSVLRRVDLARRAGAVGNQNRALFGSPTNLGSRKASSGIRSAIGASAAEPLIVNNGHSVALVVDALSTSSLTHGVRVSLVLSINSKTVAYEFSAPAIPGHAIFSIENTAANTVKILSWDISELGTTDTPTLRVVPIGQLYSPDITDTSRTRVDVFKMNSDYPNLTALKVYTDIGFIPSGVPEEAISPGSTGTPKGMNYLHTKDFNGPMYRNLLVEYCHNRGPGGAQPDALGTTYSHEWSDLLGRHAGITINPGEGIAIVSSAETAVGVQAAWGGWPSLAFAFQLDDEPSLVPTIAATGIVNGSAYRVERVSDGSLITQGTVGVGGSFSYEYTTEDTPLNLRLRVRKGTAAPYYKPYEVTFNLTSAGVSIPVSQIADA